jgi:hypothetical protein
VFPNPSNEFINVSLAGLSGKNIKAKILTIQGQVISEEIWNKKYRNNNDHYALQYLMICP